MSVPARDRVGQEPQRNHGREVEGRDGGHHAQRLPDHDLVYAAGNIFQVVPLHERRNAAGHFHILDAPAELGLGFRQGFSVFERGYPGDFVEMSFQ